MHVPPGYALFIPSAIREAVDLPVVGVGRFKDPLQAERALAEGHCDLVGVVRGQIADADFAAKARAGATEEIRLCLSCNQECVGRMGLNRWLGCIENPTTGKESRSVRSPMGAADPGGPIPVRLAGAGAPGRPLRVRSNQLTTAGSSGQNDVLVVGAGPGGLQAAISAARHGHRVTVWERNAQPGGQVRLAALVPNRAELGDMIRNQVSECRRLGVRIECGVKATVERIRGHAPSHVIVATGAIPARPWWIGGEVTNACDVCDVLAGTAVPTGRVGVIDELGFHQATSVAELLADRGCEVEVITPGMVVGQDLGITLDLEQWWMRAMAKGIVQSTDLVPMGFDGTTLTLLHHPTGENVERTPDWVVLAVPAIPADALFHELRTVGVSVDRVGDCVAPRRAHAAVIEGERAGAIVPSPAARAGHTPAPTVPTRSRTPFRRRRRQDVELIG